MNASRKPTVALFVTCLVDAVRPSVGFAALRLLGQAGARTRVPESQTCCGQPAFNSGDVETARAVAQQVVDAFSGFDRVIVPSGSCAGMLKVHYPELLSHDPTWAAKVRSFAARVCELSQFLEEQGVKLDVSYKGTAAYHDSCSSLREMGVCAEPRALLSQVRDLEVRDLDDAEVCCGFGGTFCVKYPDISTRMASDKATAVRRSGADALLAGDLGCLMNIAGRLQRDGSDIRVFHYAEVLAGMTDGAALGEPES